MRMQVPLFDPHRSTVAAAGALRAAFERVVTCGSFVLGAEVAGFEEAFAAYCGVPHCVTLANGSDALELALRALTIGPGDEVATVANAAMYATVAIRACGATPLYIDVDATTLLMSPTRLAGALTANTRAIIVTHLYGRMANVEALRAEAKALPLIEDCAQAHGAESSAGRAGSLGVIGCFSFYPTKNLGALGDGGAITSSDTALADRVRALRQYGWDAKYRVSVPGGRNSRLDELQAAFLRVRLAGLDANNERRRTIGRAYDERIDHGQIRPLPAGGREWVSHLAVVRCRQRNALRTHLERCGIATDVHYPIPDHRQPVADAQSKSLSLPITEEACAEVLSLPCFPGLTDAEVDYVIASCNSWRA